MDGLFHENQPEMTEDSVEQMLALAERLREANGGELDESAIQAVSEATGAPIEYVRLAVKLRAEKEKQTKLGNIRAQFLMLGPETRRYVFSGIGAAIGAMFNVVGTRLDQATETANGSSYSLFGMLGLLCLALVGYNISLARDARTATMAGAIYGGGFYLMSALFSMILQVQARFSELFLIPFAVIGAVAALVLFKIVEANRSRLGLKDPVKDRQDLLRQLVDLQDKLRSGEQSMTFACFDIVGSTRMKQSADALAIEFTFNEYHDFVERISRKYGGRVHSTAGDGIICAFENPAQAFGAAKNIQTGLIELNTFRNKIGTPIVLRTGIHTGTVVAPDAGDATTVNFSHVIDMAAHIQKVCPPGGIAVSSAAAAQLAGGFEAVGPDRVRAMDHEAAIWLPKQTMSLPMKGPQALPEGA
ncbi:MAG: adenylate/guanylate cyclase domain-containing protein [Fimbriimonas sp.]